MTSRTTDADLPCLVVARVIRQEGHCGAGHQVGDEAVFDGLSVQGKICIHALYSVLPKVLAMMYGAEFPWLTNKDIATHACPDARNPVVLEIRRERRAGETACASGAASPPDTASTLGD